ncbi:MlaC/ttg2D family ABC transporter substrate-binding protein [Chitinibacteraceae bacterium HSL-7]
MKQWLAALMLGLMSVVAWAADSPETITRSVSDDVLRIIRSNASDPAKVRDLVDARVSPLADYTRMTALAVGRYWKTATPEQQSQLTTEFRTMLVRTYLSALTIYKDAQVNVTGSRPGAASDEQVVRTEVTVPNQKPIPVDFSFESTKAGWKVYDISVDGISFIVSNRNQFGGVIRKDGVDGLIAQLKARNDTLKKSSANK